MTLLPAKQARPSQKPSPPQATHAARRRDIQTPIAFHTAHFLRHCFEQDFASMRVHALAPCPQLPTAPGGPAAQRPQELGMRSVQQIQNVTRNALMVESMMSSRWQRAPSCQPQTRYKRWMPWSKDDAARATNSRACNFHGDAMCAGTIESVSCQPHSNASVHGCHRLKQK